MDYKAIAEGLGLMYAGELSGDSYVMTLNGSDEYASAYSKLSKSELVDLDREAMSITAEQSFLPYVGDGYDAVLRADFAKDEYTVTVTGEGKGE